MPSIPRSELDSTDDAVLAHLQRDGRMTMAELGRAVSMSPSSVADRVRRLTDTGAIRGYSAVVDPATLGYPLTAFARLRLTAGTAKPFRDLLDRTPQVLEAHHLTGEDCFLLKIVAASMPDLEALADELARFGRVTTNLVFSSPVDRRPIPGAASAVPRDD